MATAQKRWTRCESCNRCEWNTILRRQNLVCSGCKFKVKLFRPRGRVQFDESQDEDGFYDADSGNESESASGPGQP
eukprot:9120698-Pyramimonas_sp.AAC.1